jgi:hypothetical protein
MSPLAPRVIHTDGESLPCATAVRPNMAGNYWMVEDNRVPPDGEAATT